jgi:hypothetical protein
MLQCDLHSYTSYTVFVTSYVRVRVRVRAYAYYIDIYVMSVRV